MTPILFLYLVVLFGATLACLFRYNQIDTAMKIFAIFTLLTFVNEIVAHLAAVKFKNNMPVYTIYSLVEFGLVSLYFNYSIDVFRQKNIGFVIGVIGIVVGIVNIAFVQGLNKMNSYFLIFEGIAIIGMGLFSFLRLFLKNERFNIQYYPHFWLTTILIFFWTVTLANWSLYNYFIKQNSNSLNAIDIAILVVNILIYLGISTVFILLPYMKKRYAR